MKHFLMILEKMVVFKENNNVIDISWYYSDEDIMWLGEELSDLSGIKFSFVELIK